MTFYELFGEMATIRLLDFLGDHPDFKYEWNELKKHVLSIRQNRAALNKLVNEDLIIETTDGNKKYYQINIASDIVKAVLSSDFEKAKKVAEKEAEKYGNTS